MRFNEFYETPDRGPVADSYSIIATTLGFLQNNIQQKGFSPEISTNLVLKLIRNAGIDSFSYDDLIDANNNDDGVKNLIKNITPDTVTLVTDSDETVDNPEDIKSAATSPQDIVGGMAKKAMSRRQK
jgi:hypothetical protein